ncbi:MAG TPA: 30S ribosomal protein S6 [Acidobacteriota bacterium]|nr:30S ribosomal protein S6 [Acidobacteriota bacterium]
MRRYEVVFVLAPTLTEEEVDQQAESFLKSAKDKGADVKEVDKWGKRRLAYPINKHNDGYYTIVTLEEPQGAAVAELERRFKVTETVIRFLSVRVDLDEKRNQKLALKREVRQKRRARKRAEDTREALAEKE